MASTQDYAVLSAFVYNDARGNINKITTPELLGWTVLPSSVSNALSGFTANAFQNGNEIVIAFKGTDFTLDTNPERAKADLLADGSLALGFGSARLIRKATNDRNWKATA